jgi:hypothetical protein
MTATSKGSCGHLQVWWGGQKWRLRGTQLSWLGGVSNRIVMFQGLHSDDLFGFLVDAAVRGGSFGLTLLASKLFTR